MKSEANLVGLNTANEQVHTVTADGEGKGERKSDAACGSAIKSQT